ncbi:MAG: hypothetical protein ACOCWR_05035 [Oceanidesulfovibrio sp.]
MKPRIPIIFCLMLLSLSVLGLSMAWAAPCAPLLESGARFDAVVTAASGRLLSQGPLAITGLRTAGDQMLFDAAYTPDDAAPMQLTGFARGDEVSMVADGGALPEDTGSPAWLGVCSETGITGRIGGDHGFELLPPAPEAMAAEGTPDAENANIPGTGAKTAPQDGGGEEDWPAAAEAPIIISEPENGMLPESNASGLDAVEELPPLPRPDENNATADDPVAEALRELAMENETRDADGYAIRGANATDAAAANASEPAPEVADDDISGTDCRYLPASVFSDEFPGMRLSPIHSTAATIPGRDRVCFLTLLSGEGAQSEVDFAFYDGSEPLAIMRGPGIPVTVRGLSLRDVNGDGAPEIVAVLQRTDGGYENRVYWSEKKGDGYVWVEDAVVNRHVSGQPTVGDVIAVITGEKVSTHDDAGESTAARTPEPAAPREPALTPEPIQPKRESAPAPEVFQDARAGDVLDLSGRFVRTAKGLRFIPYGRVVDTDYVVESMPPEDKARLGDITRRDSRIAAEVMRVEKRDGTRVVHIQVLQVQLL